jgi:PEP-CTERM motif
MKAIKVKSTFVAACAALMIAAAPALAQSPPVSRTIPLSFTGVVTNDVTNAIKIRQPDGSFAPYAGPVPDYPYKVGDRVTISFNATVPTQAFYARGGPYQGQLSADGIYRINIGGQPGGGGFTPGPGGVGAISSPDITGPIYANANAGSVGTGVNMTIVYDANADSYSLEFPNGRWSAFDLGAPSYTYDPATGRLSGGAVACPGGITSGCNDITPGGFALTGTENSATGSNIPVYTASAPPESYIAGLFNLVFGGSWNLPTYGSGATSVPEPGTMLLFGGGVAALIRRRRTRKA